jgi:RNA recognition motif-containing protein
MDYAAGKHRGFGFIEYASADDAEEAAFNLDGSDYMGKTLRVSLAQPNQAGKLSSTAGSGASHSADQAIWKSDDWFRSQILEGGEGVGANAESSTSLRDEEAQRDAMALR